MSLSPRSAVADGDYFLDRANAEIEAADRSPGDRASILHRKLASLYLDRVFGERAEPDPEWHPSPREKRQVLASPFMLLKPVEDAETERAFDNILRKLDAVSGRG